MRFVKNNYLTKVTFYFSGGEAMRLRTDLAVEAREIAGEHIGGVDYRTYSENGLEISRLTVKNERAARALGGRYVYIVEAVFFAAGNDGRQGE